MNIGDKIKKRRLELNLTLEEVGDGKIEPIKFKLDDQVIYIQKVIDTKIELSLCPNRVFTCQHGSKLYELRYEPETCIWHLSQK